VRAIAVRDEVEVAGLAAAGPQRHELEVRSWSADVHDQYKAIKDGQPMTVDRRIKTTTVATPDILQ
jgi:hypothetical protein